MQVLMLRYCRNFEFDILEKFDEHQVTFEMGTERQAETTKDTTENIYKV